LQKKASAQREKCNERSILMTSAVGRSQSLTGAVTCHVNDQFKLISADASYLLSIEVQTAIDFIVLQVMFPIKLPVLFYQCLNLPVWKGTLGPELE